MKTFTLILLLLSLPCSRPVLEVIDASSQRDLPGRKESPVSVHYEIRVKAGKSSNILAIDKIYVHGTPGKVKVLHWPGKERVARFSKGDTLLLVTTVFERVAKEMQQEVTLPETFRKEEVVIGYTLRGKKKYEAVREIRQLPGKMRL
jgi:hypothetical protein